MTAEAERARILGHFVAAGATRVDLPILQRAETLLDLYGEDIRGRAYTARDPLAGELMLRPDFTVPVVEMHLAAGTEQACYAYEGPVFRMQELGSERPSEYDQVGLERFGDHDSAEADAEILALFVEALRAKPLRIATGDIGLLRDAIEGLSTSQRRKAALLRHLWRPGRFRKLLDWFSGAVPRERKVIETASPFIGLRGEAEVAARLSAIEEDAAEPPIPKSEAQRIADLLALRDTLPKALARLREIFGDAPPVHVTSKRIDALAARGVDVDAILFEGAFGRTNLEYYDGFVFGFYAEAAPLPAVATGGRYDALTAAMGRSVPAVGGVVRPQLLAELP